MRAVPRGANVVGGWMPQCAWLLHAYMQAWPPRPALPRPALPCRLIFKDFEVGRGSPPVDGQEVVFTYTGYNESASLIDTSFKQGRPAQVRLGINGLIPGAAKRTRRMRRTMHACMQSMSGAHAIMHAF